MAIIVTEPVHHHHGTIGTRGVYMRTNRAAIKIIEIIIGIILCALLCGPWYGKPFWDHGCFAHDGRLGFCSGLNFIILIINIIVLVLNLINRYTIYHAERIYNIIATVLFLIASILIIWHIFDHYGYNEFHGLRGWLIASAVFIVSMFGLFLWDTKIQHGDAGAYGSGHRMGCCGRV